MMDAIKIMIIIIFAKAKQIDKFTNNCKSTVHQSSAPKDVGSASISNTRVTVKYCVVG